MSCRGTCNPGTCVQCDRVEKNPLPDELVNDFFNHLRETLVSAGKLIQGQAVIDTEDGPTPVDIPDERFEWFALRCKERLVRGAETYGNRNFLKPHVDLVEEGTQECLDLANYCLMELTKTRPDSCAGVPLGMAAYYSFLAALSLQDYAAKLRGSF